MAQQHQWVTHKPRFLALTTQKSAPIYIQIYSETASGVVNFDTPRRFLTLTPQSELQVREQSGEVGERGLEVFDPSDLLSEM